MRLDVPLFRNIWRLITPRRADTLGREQGQAILRVVVSLAVLGYFVVRHYPLNLERELPAWLVFLAVFLVFSLVVATAALRDKCSYAYRRVIANVADIAAVTFLMSRTGEVGAPLFVIYLWVTLGNGFRFGLAAMGISAVLSVAGFAVVIATTELWHRHEMLAAGVMAALVMLPGYAAHLIRQLHRARERAEEASAAKSQFLARMSHELRTPLNGILGTTDLLRNSPRLTAEDRELLGVIKESVAVSLRQIDSVLDFARIEAGKLVIEQTDFDLHRLLQGSMRMVSPAAREKKLRLLVRISPQAPFRLVGDPHHLREILLNLLSNAVKFTHSGYVALQVEPIHISDYLARLRFEIRDTGIGIAPGAMERIWESFAQEDTDTTRRYGGTGLGTTIARQLVELMGGRIAVSSIKGRGTVFWFELAFRRQADAGHAAAEASRVLVLSADAETTGCIRHIVEGAGGKVVTVASIADAVSALGRGMRLGNPWHVVLADEALAVHGGRHLAGELADKALAVETPLYLLTDAAHDVERLCEWGYAGTLPRQPQAAALANTVHASPHYDGARADAGPGVVRVEPWAWGRDAKVARRILVADDNRTNLLILEQMLQSAGYEVDVASDGESALERLAAGGYKAAVLDLHMPGLDGVDLLRRYRLLKPGAKVPIVMLTADATFDAKSDCADAGADAFLTKPVTADELLSTLERLIQERRIHVLPRPAAARERVQAGDESQVVDVSVLAELDRLCREPTRLVAVVEAFEAEGEALLARMTEAVTARNHSAFAEWVHAMKGNAANVGALQLVAACRRIESVGVLEFRRDGAGLVRDLGECFAVARGALRELTPTSAPGRIGPT